MKPKSDEAHEAFQRYAAAKERADASMDMHDAMLAGRARAAFLNTFVEPHQQVPTADIIQFKRRG